MSYYTIFYVIVFSAIPHKEQRFLMPIIPFAALVTGEHIAQNLKNYQRLYRYVLRLYVFVNILVFGLLN